MYCRSGTEMTEPHAFWRNYAMAAILKV